MADWAADERDIVQRQIASIIDYPSIYMGGPSRGALRKADEILAALERGDRVHSTTCDHHGWLTWGAHGASCPDCWMVLGRSQAEIEDRLGLAE